jgi:4-amino-4-deoxy-L-arabinose transferase-like glycosyltransferase
MSSSRAKKQASFTAQPVSLGETLRRLDVFLVFVFALLARLIWMSHNIDTLFFEVPLVDAAEHHEHASHLLGLLYNPDFALRAYFRAPGYAFVLAALRGVLGLAFFGVFMLQHVLGAALCAALYAIGTNLFSRLAGVAAALVLALYGPQLFFESRLLPPVWTQTFLLAAVWLVWLIVRTETIARAKAVGLALSAGALLGLGALMRPNLLAAGLGLALLLIWQTRPRWLGLIFVAGLCAAVSPVTTLNAMREPGLVPIAYGSGVNLYIANGPERSERLGVRPGSEWRRLMALPKADIPAERYTSAENAAWFTRHALREMAANSLDTTGKLLWHFMAQFSPLEVSRDEPVRYHLDGFALSPLLLSFWIPSLFGAAGLVWLWGFRRRLMWTLAAPLLAYAAGTALYFFLTRYRMPTLPLTALPAGAALHLLLYERERLFKKRRLFVSGLLAAGMLAAFALVFPPDYDLDTRVGHIAEVRILTLVRHDLARAQETLESIEKPGDEESYLLAFVKAQRWPYSPDAVTLAASLHDPKADPDRIIETAQMLGGYGNRAVAAPLLSSLLRTPNYSAHAAAMLSPWYARAHQFADCLKTVDLGLRDDPNLPSLHEEAARCAAFGGDFDRARRHLEVLMRMQPQNGQYFYQRALVEQMAKRPEAARVWMERARSLGFAPPPQ